MWRTTMQGVSLDEYTIHGMDVEETVIFGDFGVVQSEVTYFKEDVVWEATKGLEETMISWNTLHEVIPGGDNPEPHSLDIPHVHVQLR